MFYIQGKDKTMQVNFNNNNSNQYFGAIKANRQADYIIRRVFSPEEFEAFCKIAKEQDLNPVDIFLSGKGNTLKGEVVCRIINKKPPRYRKIPIFESYMNFINRLVKKANQLKTYYNKPEAYELDKIIKKAGIK